MVICPPLRTETNAAGDPALCSESDTKAACRPSNRLPFAVPHLNPPKRNTTWVDCNLQLTLIQIHDISTFGQGIMQEEAWCNSFTLTVLRCSVAGGHSAAFLFAVAEAMNQMRQQNPGRDSFYVDALGFIMVYHQVNSIPVTSNAASFSRKTGIWDQHRLQSSRKLITTKLKVKSEEFILNIF